MNCHKEKRSSSPFRLISDSVLRIELFLLQKYILIDTTFIKSIFMLNVTVCMGVVVASLFMLWLCMIFMKGMS